LTETFKPSGASNVFSAGTEFSAPQIAEPVKESAAAARIIFMEALILVHTFSDEHERIG
jgi:hypothetical protein